MSSTWVELPGVGAFVNFERNPCETPELPHTLIAELLGGLGIAEQEVLITASVTAKWRSFSWRAIEQAISNPAIRSILLLVGTPSEVHLGARIATRPRRYNSDNYPPSCWVVAESDRFPRARMATACRRWLTIAATHGHPDTGGIVAATNLLNLKNEVSLEREGNLQLLSAANMLFCDRLDRDDERNVAGRIRRLYPVTLLGPRYASIRNADLLRAAGARIEQVGESLIVDVYPSIVPAWDPEFLAATLELRRLVWPLTIQNPADALGLAVKEQFEVPRRTRLPWEPSNEDVQKELKRQKKEFDAFVKRNREAGSTVPPITGELVALPPKPTTAEVAQTTPTRPFKKSVGAKRGK